MSPSPFRLALAAAALALLGACAHAASPAPPPLPLLPATALPRYPDGTLVDLSAERGNVLVIDFWATWCEPCTAALPEWDALAAAYRDRGVRLYAVSVDGDPNKVAAFLREVKVEVPVLLDRDAALAEGSLHLQTIPSALIVDKQGAIRSTHQGYSPGEVKGFAREIDPLLGEK
ncbi:MAG TPA: TlpA disulfide reductase family protein [Myxococcales bacterium]|nr:TlpA disulfide reductase family protein [Myxococcales bacterium]